MNKTSSIALLATAAFLSLSTFTATAAEEGREHKVPAVDQTTTQSVGTGVPATCDSQGFLSTDCGPAAPGKGSYPENALQGLNLGF